MRGICYLHGFVERRERDNATERFVAFFTPECTPAAERGAFRRRDCLNTGKPPRRDLLLFKSRAHDLSEAAREIP
jgi:hypothetical protein